MATAATPATSATSATSARKFASSNKTKGVQAAQSTSSGRGRRRGTAPASDAEDEQQTKRGHNASAAAHARWSAEEAAEQDLRTFFTEIPLEDALTILAKMRGNCEIAAKIINQRTCEETPETRCKSCNGTKPINKQWFSIRPYRDVKTGTMGNHYFCSPICVATENQRTQGIAAISDRGGVVKDGVMVPRRDPDTVRAELQKAGAFDTPSQIEQRQQAAAQRAATATPRSKRK